MSHTPEPEPVPEHYWVECRFCSKSTVAFERYCRHCDRDRAPWRGEAESGGAR